MLHPSRRCLPYVLQVTLLPSTLLRNHTSVKLHVKHQCNPKNNPIDKTKKIARKTTATLYFISSFPCTISLNFFDESQLKLRCQISHSQRENDNFPQRHSPFRYLCDFCRHISLYDTFICLTWQTVAYYLCFRHQSVNVTFARKRFGTTNV